VSNILSELRKKKGEVKDAKRRGRGYGSGKGGHTIGKGNKGQKARSGGKIPIWFEGGQTPFVKRIPYARGFVNHNSKDVTSLNIFEMMNVIKTEKSINPDILKKYGVIGQNIRYDYVKILGRGEIKTAVNFTGFLYSAKAKEKITKSGGTAEK
jgi:large subunit ribosomal protein L15